MAVTHVNSTTFASTGHTDTSLTNAVPSGTVNGDLLLWTIDNSDGSGGSSPTPATPTGWAVWSTSVANGTLSRLSVFYRWASSEPASYTLTGLGANGWTGVMSAFRGVNTTTPQDAAPTTGTGGTPPSITTTCDGCLIVEHGACITGSGITGSWTSTSTIAGQVSQTQGASSNATTCVGYQTKSTTGAISPNALTCNNVVSGSQVRVTSALRPAAPAHISTRDVLASAAAATVTGTYTATPNQGDLLVATLYYNAVAGAGAMPAGWTLAGTEQATGSVASDGTLGVWWKIAGASEPTGITATATGASIMRLGLHAYRNTAASSPVEASGVTGSGASSVTSLAAAALTLTNSDDLLFAAYAWNGGTTAPAVDSGLTLRTAVARLADADASSVASGTAPTLTWTTAQKAGSVVVAFKSSSPIAIGGSSAASGTGALSLSGAGAGAGASTATGALALVGTGSPTGPTSGTGALALTGTGTAQAASTATGSLTLAGTGTAAAPATGTGTLALTGTADAAAPATATGALTITGAASAAGASTAVGALSLAGAGTATAPTAGTGSLTLDGNGTPAADVGTGAIGKIRLNLGTAAVSGDTTGTGTLTLTGTGTSAAAATATGALSLTGASTPAAPATGNGNLILDGSAPGATSTSGTGALALTGSASATAEGTGTGTLVLVGAGASGALVVSTGSLSLDAAGAIAATAAGTAHLVLTGAGAAHADGPKIDGRILDQLLRIHTAHAATRIPAAVGVTRTPTTTAATRIHGAHGTTRIHQAQGVTR